MPRQALYWETTAETDEQQRSATTRCRLCPHRCRIKPGQSGICLARRNVAGTLVAWSYGKVTSLALDPIEKKPLKHFFPGSRILSVGSFGCNFHCGFCQNWPISRQEAPYRLIMPDELVGLASQAVEQDNLGIAYTYNEPLVGFEYVLDCSRLARQHNLKNVLVTNGYINEEPLEELLPYIDALNIDLKAWNQAFYGKICGGRLDVVRRTITRCAAACHVEVTTLLLPGLNDDEKEIAALAEWLASLNPELPLHLSRHHPDYQMDQPPSITRSRIEELAAVARRSLKNVWLGNL